jgi:Leucine-rich repeat (LRR) protein
MSNDAYKQARFRILGGARRRQKSLDLSSKQLSALPPEIGQMSELQDLDLSANQLSELPPEIGLLKQLRGLNLSNNQLRTLPSTMAELKELRWIDLKGNPLTDLSPEIVRIVNDTNAAIATRPIVWRNLLMWIEQFFESCRKSIVNIIVVAATALACYVIVVDSLSGSYLIEPIGVPEEFSKKVLDKESVAALLRNEIGVLVKEARNEATIKSVTVNENMPEIKVGGTELSVRTVSGLLRDFVFSPYTRIAGVLSVSSGEVGKSDMKVRLTLAKSDSMNGPFFDEEGRFPDVLKRGAFEALKVIDPFTAASYLGRGAADDRKPEALALLSSALATSRRTEAPVWLQRIFYFGSDIPRGELIRANILLSMNNISDAKESFELANTEFSLRHLGNPDWYAAQDGIAVSRLLQGDYDGALTAVLLSLKLQENYVTALFHHAQVYDFRSRCKLRRDVNPYTDSDAACELTAHSGDTCAALADVRQAQALYRHLQKIYPDFALAYSQNGTMLLQEVAYLKRKRGFGCPSEDAKLGRPDDRLMNILDKLEVDVDKLFRDALRRNSNLYDAWFQWGILLFQRQDPELLQTHLLTVAERLALLDSADEKYETALRLVATDYYIWFLKGQALAERSRLSAVTDWRKFANESIEALCTSMRLNTRESKLREATLSEVERISASFGSCEELLVGCPCP